MLPTTSNKENIIQLKVQLAHMQLLIDELEREGKFEALSPSDFVSLLKKLLFLVRTLTDAIDAYDQRERQQYETLPVN